MKLFGTLVRDRSRWAENVVSAFSIDDDEDEENPENPGLASKLTQVASETLRLHGFHEDKVQKH
jgi:hypothetical protein